MRSPPSARGDAHGQRLHRDIQWQVPARPGKVGVWRREDDTDRADRSEGILTADMWVDLDIEGNRNLPHDRHPSAIANRQYAWKLMEFLRTIM